MAVLLPSGRQAFEDGAGRPLVGGRLFTYAAGTNTPLPTYTDAAGTIANTNPALLDARGEAVVFWRGSYKATLQAADGTVIWTQDNISTAGTEPTSFRSTAALTAADTSIGTASLRSDTGFTVYSFLQGDYSGRSDVIASAGTPITSGAWVPQQSDGVWFKGMGPAYLQVSSKLKSGRVSVMDGFGVKMDTTTNDTDGVNTAAAALHDAGGGVLEIPRGLLLTDQISIPATNGGGVSLRGEGQRATYIRKATASSTTPLIYAEAADVADPTETYISFSGFALQPALGTGNVADAMMLERIAKFDISDIDFRDAKTGVVLKGSLIGSLSNFNIQGCLTGLLTGANDGQTPYPNEINLWGGVISDCTQYGIDSAGSGLHLHGVDMERNGSMGQLASGHIVYRATSDDEIGSSFCSIQGVWMEGGFGRGVYVEPGMGGMFSLSMNDTQILGQAGPSAVFASGIISANNVRLPSPTDVWQVLPSAAYCCVTNSNIANIDDQLPRHRKHYEGIRGTAASLDSGGMASDFTIGSGKSALWRSLDGSIQHEIGIDPTTSRLRYVPSNNLGVDMGALQFVGALTVAADNAAAAAAGVPNGHLYRTADGAIRYRP